MKVEDLDDDSEHDKSETPEEEILEQARDAYRRCLKAEEKQRERESQDLRFQVPELQWEDKERADRTSPGLGIAPRPCMAISLLDQPQALLINQMRQADLATNIHPVSDEAEDSTAEMLQGLKQEIDRRSRAELARAWAFQRAVACGRGAYRIATEYDDQSPREFGDQRIVVKRILHQEGVYFDPSAEEPDFSDGKFAFVCMWLPKAEFRRRYPDSRAADVQTNPWLEGIRQQAPEWVQEGDILVAEYWYKVITTEHFRVGDEEREIEAVEVWRAMVNGWELLEPPVRWPGKYIPLIPVVGRELTPFDEERRWFGLVRPARDPQKAYNFAASSFIERISAEPKAPWVGAAEVFEGYEKYYEQANVRNFPFLPYNAVVKNGQPLPPPQRSQIDLTGASLAAQGMQTFQGQVQAATALFDPSLGQLPAKDRSGRAIMALQSQADAGTGHFLSNLADISMTLEGKIFLDLAPVIYDRPGRVVQILKGEGDQKKAESVMLNAPFLRDGTSKRPVRWVEPREVPAALLPPRQFMPAQPQPPGPQASVPPQGVPPWAPQGPQGAPTPKKPLPPKVKLYDLSKGTYGCAVTVGKGFQTRLQEGADKMAEFLGNAKDPQLMMAMLPQLLEWQDWPGAKDMAKTAAKLRDQAMPFLRDDSEEGQQSSEQLKGQLQGMQGQLKQLQGAFQQAVQTLQSKQTEQAARIQVAEIQANAQLEKAKLDNETKMAIAGLDAQIVGVSNEVKVLVEHVRQLSAERSSLREQAHARAMASEGRAAESEASERQRVHELTMQELGRPEPEFQAPPPEGQE